MKKYVFLLIILFAIIVYRIIFINYYRHAYYLNELDNKMITYVYGSSAPRGRIIDANGNILVDNKGIKAIYYTKIKGISKNDEIEIAYTLASILNIEIDENVLKDFWLVINNNGEDLITEEEWNLYDRRKLSSEDINDLKYERITDNMLDSLTDLDKKCATIYNLMNKGYSYSKKLIIKDLSDEEYSKIVDLTLPGITSELIWERIYNYGDTLKDIFGTIGSIPGEDIEAYLEKGYSLDDVVGLSYLELEYEDYLKGEKDLYVVGSDNTLSLVKSGSRGSDLLLSIDIDVQLELESIIKENILNAKKRIGTDYFEEVYSILGDPNTGAIIAMSGQKLVDEENEEFTSVNTDLINTSYTVGSIVKMATMSTGYKYGVIDIGTTVTDGCVKLYNVPIKCSYKSLGRVNDLTAISRSSNYYQYLIAIGLTNNKYSYNMKFNTTLEDFNKMRNVFAEYGLGTITGVDLPNETIGIIGTGSSGDLLLNLSIGQYDTYTPIELFQYVNTVATLGIKKTPYLMKEIIGRENITNDYEVESIVSLDNKYLIRLREAMHLATTSGTARGYIDSIYNPAGKTGTSETFIDTDNDGVMDTETTSIAFVGYAPYDDPKYSIIVLAPNIYVDKGYSYSKVYITRYISNGIMKFLFEKE